MVIKTKLAKLIMLQQTLTYLKNTQRKFNYGFGLSVRKLENSMKLEVDEFESQRKELLEKYEILSPDNPQISKYELLAAECAGKMIEELTEYQRKIYDDYIKFNSELNEIMEKEIEFSKPFSLNEFDIPKDIEMPTEFIDNLIDILE